MQTLIALARDKYKIVLSDGEIAAVRARGAPIDESGDCSTLDLLAWLIADMRGGLE